MSQFSQYYDLFRDFTMVPEATYIKNLELIHKFGNVDGCIVECGTWKGGMIAGVAKMFGNNRKYHLFDSFEGLPEAETVDGDRAIEYQKQIDSPDYHNNCKVDESFVLKALGVAGINNFTINKGWFSDTLPIFKNTNEQIAILRIDGDWFQSTMDCFNNLFDRVVDGGLIIIDDYYAWDGCTKAVHNFLSNNDIPDRIMQYDNTVCYIVKSHIGLIN